jgi:hypothetical protein
MKSVNIIKATSQSNGIREGLKICYRCGKQFEVNEEILAKTSSNGKSKRYHIKCAIEVNLI